MIDRIDEERSNERESVEVEEVMDRKPEDESRDELNRQNVSIMSYERPERHLQR